MFLLRLLFRCIFYKGFILLTSRAKFGHYLNRFFETIRKRKDLKETLGFLYSRG